MRAVVQRVRRAQVRVAGDVVGEVGEGLCVLLGVTHGDGKPQIEKTASGLLVSQFTLYADVRKGRSPGWSHAAPGDVAEPVVAAVAEELRKVYGLHVETGKFGAMMDVELVNDGPFTLLIEA